MTQIANSVLLTPEGKRKLRELDRKINCLRTLPPDSIIRTTLVSAMAVLVVLSITIHNKYGQEGLTLLAIFIPSMAIAWKLFLRYVFNPYLRSRSLTKYREFAMVILIALTLETQAKYDQYNLTALLVVSTSFVASMAVSWLLFMKHFFIPHLRSQSSKACRALEEFMKENKSFMKAIEAHMPHIKEEIDSVLYFHYFFYKK